jgi:predicted transcriptional regulator of viral defense system
MKHSRDSENLIEFVEARGVARTKEVTDAGFPRVLLTRLMRQGRLQRLGRGLYATSDHALTEWHDLAEVAKAVPSAVVTLISALAFHEIGTHVPHDVWIARPVGARKPTYHVRLRVTRFSEPYFSAGVEVHQVEGVPVRIFNAAKTVADCFRLRSKVGYDVAIEALREGLKHRKFTLDELNHYARINRVDRIMRPYIEAFTA